MDPQPATNALRSGLREYYPAALEAFPDLADRDTLGVLVKAPTPTAGVGLTLSQIRAALKRGGRQRNLERRANEIQIALRTAQFASPAAVADAFASTTCAPPSPPRPPQQTHQHPPRLPRAPTRYDETIA